MSDGAKFTWFPKMTATVERIPVDQVGPFVMAVIEYGTNGTEPNLEWPFDAIFESIRDDVDNSKRSRANGRSGGLSKKAPSEGAEPPLEECGTPLADDAETPSEGAEPIPIHTNTEQPNTDHPTPEQAKPEEDEIPYAQIVDALNKATGKRFRASNEQTRKRIKARWAEGYRLHDFLAVISTKASEWGRDPSMCGYLRPSTLFGPNFESYLNRMGGAAANDYSEYD